MMSLLLSEFYDKYMSFADVAALAGAISAIAFLVSPVLLNIQVHSTEKNQRTLTQKARAGRTADIAMRLMSSDFAGAKMVIQISRSQFLDSLWPIVGLFFWAPKIHLFSTKGHCSMRLHV